MHSASIPVMLRRLIVMASAALMLTACANPFADDAPTLSEILEKGWIGSKSTAAAPENQPPLYCYATIASEDCYDAPLPGQGERLVGYQGPPPLIYDEL